MDPWAIVLVSDQAISSHKLIEQFYSEREEEEDEVEDALSNQLKLDFENLFISICFYSDSAELKSQKD